MDLNVTGNLAAAVDSQDYTTAEVPLAERRGPFMLGLLWITMVTGFPSVLAGFDWYKAGLTLPQVLVCSFIAIAILLGYSIPACLLGAQSGQTYALLSRQLFGRIGSLIVSLNVAWISILWYGLTAVFLATGLEGLFHLPINALWLSVILATLMSFNNFFGFAGVANFAGYVAAPILIVWIGIAFGKVSLDAPTALWHEHQTASFSSALSLVCAFVIGYAAWGNEPDYWRYAKPNKTLTVIPLVVSLLIGALIFPLTGWLMAHMSGITSYAEATKLMNNYVFGGIALLAAVVLFVTYFAQNDANLYAAINGIANLRQFPRKWLALCLTAGCALCAALLSLSPNSFESVASMSSTVLPCPTVVMIGEWYVLAWLTKTKPDFHSILDMASLPAFRWPAVIAIFCGSSVGLATAGIIPGLERLHVGICSLQAWIATLVVYLLLRWIERSKSKAPVTVPAVPVE